MILKMYKIRNLLCGLLLLTTFARVLTDLQNDTGVSPQRVAEGGKLPQESENKIHLNQQHDTKILDSIPPTIKNLTSTQEQNATSIKLPSNQSKNAESKPVTEKSNDIEGGVPKKNDKKPSVAKKGADFSENDTTVNMPLKETTSVLKSTSSPIAVAGNSTTSTTVPPTPIPKKPTKTEHDEFVLKKEDTLKSDQNENNFDELARKNKRANYVIPIVAVILSVPLVAIIISVLYKRGTDWWQHRNYRRMDFLIEGMYNT